MKENGLIIVPFYGSFQLDLHSEYLQLFFKTISASKDYYGRKIFASMLFNDLKNLNDKGSILFYKEESLSFFSCFDNNLKNEKIFSVRLFAECLSNLMDLVDINSCEKVTILIPSLKKTEYESEMERLESLTDELKTILGDKEITTKVRVMSIREDTQFQNLI